MIVSFDLWLFVSIVLVALIVGAAIGMALAHALAA